MTSQAWRQHPVVLREATEWNLSGRVERAAVCETANRPYRWAPNTPGPGIGTRRPVRLVTNGDGSQCVVRQARRDADTYGYTIGSSGPGGPVIILPISAIEAREAAWAVRGVGGPGGPPDFPAARLMEFLVETERDWLRGASPVRRPAPGGLRKP